MSGSNAEVYKFTLEALSASLSSHITKQNREQCDRFIQDLKQREECMPIMSQLLAEDESICNQYMKLLALSILNDWIKLWWNRLPDASKLAVKQLSLDLLTSPLAVHESSAIRMKIAMILANVVERVFPQYWPTLVPEMISVWLSSPFARQDVILKMFEMVIVDSVDTDFNSALPTLRRQEIVAGIVEAQKQLFETSYQYLVYCNQEYSQIIGSNASVTSGQGKVVSDALNSLLSMLSALSALVKIDDYCAAPHNFALVLVEMGNSPHIQVKAMEVLLVLVQQRMSVELFSVVLQALSQVNVQRMPEDLEESLQFQRTYAAVLHTLLSQHIGYLLDSASTYYTVPDAVRTLNAYLAKTISVLEQSPSIRLPGDIIKEWVKIFRDKSVSQCPSFRDIAMTVLNVFMQKCRKPLWTEFTPGTTYTTSTSGARVRIQSEQYADVFEVEFEDSEEWSTEYYGTFKSQFRLLTQTVTEQFCVLSATTLSQYMESLLARDGVHAIGSHPASVECKTLLLEFDMLHYVYAPLLQVLLPPDASIKKSSSEGGKDGVNPIGRADILAVQTITMATLNKLLAWKPPAILQMEQYKILQYHYPLLKLSTEHLGAAFTILFSALSNSISTAPVANPGAPLSPTKVSSSSKESSLDYSTRISGAISSLTQHCAVEIVHTGFFSEFFQQVGSILTQVSHTAVQNNMRQALMALSDHITDPALRVRTLSLAVEDVLQKWSSQGAALFSTTDSLLEALLAQVVTSHVPVAEETVPGVPSIPSLPAAPLNVDNRFENVKRLIDTFLLAAKRITYPPLPLEVWTKGTPVSPDEFMQIFPFAPAWLQLLPGTFHAVDVLHSLWSLPMRRSFEGMLQAGGQPGAQSELIAAICLPEVGEIAKAAGMKLSPSATANALSPRFAFELRELRIFLYQLLAQAAAHKSLYFCPGYEGFMEQLTAYLPYMDNAHLVLLMRNFVEQYVLNALPMFYPQVSKFLEGFMSTTLQRIGTAWDRNSSFAALSTPEAQFHYQVYRMCSIPPGFNGLPQGLATVPHSNSAVETETFAGFTKEEIENARDHIIGDVTKAYGDLLAALLGLRGFLFTPYAGVASAAAADLLVLNQGSAGAGAGACGASKKGGKGANTLISIVGKGKEKAVRKRVSFDNSESEVSIFDTPSEAKEPISEDQQVELGKQARRQALFALLHTQYVNVTKPYVSSIIAMICLPDASACKFCIQMAQKLLDLSIIDARFIVPVAKEAFTAALSVLLQQEKWSIGLEWELIEYVLDVYLMLVVGEGRHPVSTGAGSGYPGSNNNSNSSAGAGGSAGGAGATGALVPIHHHTARSEWPQQILLSLNGVTREKLAELDSNLQKILAKKKRRGLMKDLITEIIAANNANNANANSSAAAGGGVAAGSVFASHMPSVLDVRHRLMKAQKAGAAGSKPTSSEFDLSKLFE